MALIEGLEESIPRAHEPRAPHRQIAFEGDNAYDDPNRADLARSHFFLITMRCFATIMGNTQVRSLNLIRASGSTARVLNLALVKERFGETEDYRDRPLFQTPMLNGALILKHAVRPDERDLFENPPVVTTKVVFPFSRSELRLGGRVALMGERVFDRVIKDSFGSAAAAKVSADLELLDLINTLPAFDPFLMRERLRQSGYNPARCYFDLSEADVQRMRAFVTGEISELVNLAFVNGGDGSRDLARRLADKLLTDDTAKVLDPLRQALRLSEDDYREGIFAWKGFLYYRWLAAELFPRLEDFKRELASLRVTGADGQARTQLAAHRERLAEVLGIASSRVEASLLGYGRAFAGLSSGDATDFRAFLLEAPSMFIPIGEAMGLIQHILSFWSFRFPQRRIQILQADEAFEMFADFLASLESLTIVTDDVGQTLAV